jgi:hypothetical protein
MYTLYAMLKEELEFVRARMKQHYNKYRLEGLCLEREDKVYLISRNLCIKRLSKKLDFKKIGPFKVDKRISISNYRLLLLVSMKLQINVFYILLLELVLRNVRLATDIKVEDEEEE